MKKKISAIFMCVALGAIAIAGASLAYFTDTDAQKNTFTTGNVAIDLYEDFGDNKDGLEKLIPATGSVKGGDLENAVTKKVYVENTGSEDAYVRVHIAIPAILDDGDPTFDAAKNVLHFNYNTTVDPSSIGEGKWDWTNSATDDKYDGTNWNFYTTTIDDIKYNVYVVTYGSALKNGDVTCDAIHQVYLDSKVTNADITKIKETLGDKWYIYVAAEGAQTAGFDNAYDALNTAFGNPTDSTYTSKIDWKTVSGKTWTTTVTP